MTKIERQVAKLMLEAEQERERKQQHYLRVQAIYEKLQANEEVTLGECALVLQALIERFDEIDQERLRLLDEDD